MSDDQVPRIRPYVITGANAAERGDILPLEALVAVSAHTDLERTAFERRTIIELCLHQPRSIAELASHLDLPLGVVQLLVGDMAATGAVQVSETANDREFIERLIEGITAL